MPDYHATREVPPIVRQAMAGADRLHFERSCSIEVGRLLHVLASHVVDGVIGEIGSGCGVGTAWLVSGLHPQATLVTVEADPGRAANTEILVEGFPNTAVLCADWRAILAYGPFALLFVDGGDAKQQPSLLLNVLRPGGLIVMDDFTPEEHWPPEWCGRPDALRAAWLDRTDVIATELLVTPTSAVILVTKKAS